MFIFLMLHSALFICSGEDPARSDLIWQKRCRDCRLNIRKIPLNPVCSENAECGVVGVVLKASSLGECQSMCRSFENECYAVHFRTGSGASDCELVFSLKQQPLIGKPHWNYIERSNWDVYDLVRKPKGKLNLAWRPLCKNCNFISPFPQNPMRSTTMALPLHVCKEMARDLSATVVEYSFKNKVHLCVIIWGGNIWGLSGPKTTRDAPGVDAYVLIDPYFVGCYHDNKEERLMKYAGQMDQTECDSTCASQGAEYYGIQGSQECYCGGHEFRQGGLWNDLDPSDTFCSPDLRMSASNPKWKRPEMAITRDDGVWAWWKTARNVWWAGHRVNSVFEVSAEPEMKWETSISTCTVRRQYDIFNYLARSLQFCKEICQDSPTCVAVMQKSTARACMIVSRADGRARRKSGKAPKVVEKGKVKDCYLYLYVPS